MFKTAVLTRGYSRENDYHWKASWLDRGDSVPDRPIREFLKDWMLKDMLRGNIPGVVVAELRGQFGVLLNGLPTDYRSDVSPGPIYVSFAFLELTQAEARAIACAFLKDWEERSKALVSLISRAKSDPEWDFDVEKLRNFIETLPPMGGVTGPPYHRVKETYRRPEEDGFKALADKLDSRELDGQDGLKVVVGHPYDSEAQRRICEEADFIVLPSFSMPSEPPAEAKKKLSSIESTLFSVRSKQNSRNYAGLLILGALAIVVLTVVVKKKEDPALSELVSRLEAKLRKVPGTDVLMCSTEMTVKEWKLYLRSAGLVAWRQPSKEFQQDDDHPIVNISWDEVTQFCEWLSTKTGKEWRLPKNIEWETVVGTSSYPWGDHFPPRWDDGNYAILADGKADQDRIGSDGILGTAPVGSFRPNALGFYDLGGNVGEWMSDGFDKKDPKAKRVFRGGNWQCEPNLTESASRSGQPPTDKNDGLGFRLVRGGL